MRTIQKGQEPASLTLHRQQPHAVYDNYTDKVGLRTALIAEQRGICCYCQSRIRPNPDRMKIEHWQCQAEHPERQLDYDNLLGACFGGEGGKKESQHCDTRKGNQDLCFSVCDPAHPIEMQIRFSSGGEISSVDPDINAAINKILNLNWIRLVKNRKSALTGLLQAWGKRNVDYSRELKKWDGSDGGELEPYSQIVVHYLLKKLGKQHESHK